MMLSLIAASALATAPYSNGVPASLLHKLTTGVNVTRWFCYLGPGDQSEHFRDYLLPADYAAFRAIGAKFVRLCVAPTTIYENGKPNQNLGAIDRGLDKLTSHNLAVIWDLHDNGQLKLDAPGADDSGLVRFWAALASHYKGKHYSDLIFEIVNEPVFNQNPSDWYKLQEQVVKAIRAVDPKRTILVSPTSWSGIDALQKMPVLKEKNLVYTVHCYDPFFFTHQGAEWVGEYPQKLRSVPFPSSPEAVDAILSQNDPKYRGTLEDYGKAHYNDAYLLSRLKLASDWGSANHVPMLLGEFGAYPKVSPPASRARWFEGMRKAIDQLGLPNSIWGYDDGLGLGRTLSSDGKIHLDPHTLEHFYHVRPK